MKTAGGKHRRRVALVHSILESNQVGAIGTVTGLGFLCSGLARWDMKQPLKPHHL
jgi:hypothetical protein